MFRNACRKSHRYGGMDGYTYTLNGRTYRDVDSLWTEEIEELAKNVSVGADIFGEKVLRIHHSIPTFDSGDREWDSAENEYLMFDGKDIHLIVMRGGYRIARLSFYEKLRTADNRMKPVFEKLNWSMDGIAWM